MRTRWVTGSATDVDGNYPGRYITPWREDEDVLQPDGTGTDNPILYPFDQMTTKQFVACIARVYSWEVEWSVSFFGANYSLTRGGTLEVKPQALFPVPGGNAEIGENEEYRWGAGLRWQASEDVPVENAESSAVSVFIGGVHQYQLPGAVPQRFRPRVSFSYALVFRDVGGDSQDANWFVLPSRLSTASVGLSSMQFASVDPETEDTWFPPYFSQQGVGFVVFGSIFAGPATVSGSISIRPKRWWQHRDGFGDDPIFDATSGAKLRSTRATPSTQPVGQTIAGAGLSGTRFVA